MQTLQEAILHLEPRLDLLHDCLGFGRFAEVMVTSDGYFLGRAWDEIGFDHFLGHPSPAAIARTRSLFRGLSADHQKELIRHLYTRRIPPEALGLPSDNHIT